MTDNVVHKSDTDNDNRLIKDEDEDEGVIETQNDNILGIHIFICNGCFSVLEMLFVFDLYNGGCFIAVFIGFVCYLMLLYHQNYSLISPFTAS